MFSRAIYTRSPIWLQEVLLSMREVGRQLLRERDAFESVLREIEESQWLEPDALAEFQLRRLHEVVSKAGSFVPYYRDAFRRHGFDPTKMTSLADVSRIPLLSKREVARQPRAFLREDATGRLFRGSTSGTTGSPLVLYQNLDAIVREHAFVSRLLRWAGFRPGEKRAWIRGDMVVPAAQMDPPFWRMNRPARMLMMSSYHLSERNAPAYLEALKTFDPVLIQAYPSSIAFLAAFMDARSRQYEGSRLRAIVTSSEMLLPEARLVIERTFGCPVFDHYGSFERVVFISNCEKGRLHVHADYGYFEVVDADESGVGEIVGTGFNNPVMPLIRYRTGDRASLAKTQDRCPCGRHWPVVERIEGRRDDYVVTKDGRHITRLGHVFTGVAGVAEGQIVQEAAGKVMILVVPTGNASSAVEARVMANARQRFGPLMDIEVRTVDRIPRERSGKLRLVVRHV